MRPVAACLPGIPLEHAYGQGVGDSVRNIPLSFQQAVDSIARVDLRDDLVVNEIDAPGKIAPYAIAFAGDVRPTRHATDSELATGRFIVLYDEEEPDAWGGPFRVVCYAQAPLETDIGVDPFLADVAWSWLIDALDSRKSEYKAASGTATKVLSTGFGELARQGDGATIEIRASWSPATSDLASHIEAWGELLCQLAGRPPETDGVASIQRSRTRRD